METFDFWDTPQEEMGDIASSVDGALVWAAAAICLAILVSRQFCKCCSYLTEAGLLDLVSLILAPLASRLLGNRTVYPHRVASTPNLKISD